MRRLLALAVLLGVVAAVVVVVQHARRPAADPVQRLVAPTTTRACSLYASPSGSDGANGSVNNPVQSLAVLDRLLSPGQTGCLEAGQYGSQSTSYTLAKSGTAAGQITITAAPGASVTVNGYIDMAGAYTTLSGLNIDDSNTLSTSSQAGSSCPHPVSDSLEINGQDDIFEDNNYYQSVPSLRSNGIGVGWNGQPDNAIIRDNRIHDVGQCQDYDHLIYLSHGSGVQIYDNWMWNDPHGWGVQIYPAATDAQVHDNVIDGAGSGFVIGGGSNVTGNTITNNVVMNSTGLPQAGLTSGTAISTCCGFGSGNTFSDNDSYNNPGGIGNTTGLTATGNITTNPNLANPTNHDYRPTVATPDLLKRIWDGSAAGGRTSSGGRAAG